MKSSWMKIISVVLTIVGVGNLYAGDVVESTRAVIDVVFILSVVITIPLLVGVLFLVEALLSFLKESN